MLVFLNGQVVPEEQAVVSVFDRSFLYGDGLFETLLVQNGQPFRWHQHLARLRLGAEFLKIPFAYDATELRESCVELVAANHLPNCLMRLTLSRGIGVRGYSPSGADRPCLVMTEHAAPAVDPRQCPRWRLITASPRLAANDPLAQFKTCNKLPQILARAEAESANAQEALLLNTDGHVVEAASSNLFWCEGSTVCTPPLASGILPGITRAAVLELCRQRLIPTRQADILPGQLREADGLFLSLSSVGIVEGLSIDGHPLRQSPLTEPLRVAYAQLVKAETAAAL